MDPFETLGIARRFLLDVREVEQKHRDLSKALHPDRHTASTSAERRVALSRAIEVNEAFRVVRDPIRGAPRRCSRWPACPWARPASRSPTRSSSCRCSRTAEALEAAHEKRDPAAVAVVLGRAQKLRASAEEALAVALDGGGGPALAVPFLGRLRYAARFVEEARRAEEDLENP